MGLSFRRAFTISTRSIESPAVPFTAASLADLLGGGVSKSGISVTQDRALGLTAFWNGVRLISESIASVPLCVYALQGRSRIKAVDHPLFPLLHDEPNPDMSSFTVREMAQGQLTIHGNAYIAIRRDGAGRIRELWPLVSQRVEPKRVNGQLVYIVTLDGGGREPWAASEILHVPGLSFDGIKGKSVIAAAREALGSGIAIQDYGSTFFRHGGRVPGVVETQLQKIDGDTKKNLEETWLSGRDDNWHKVAFLSRGMKYVDAGIKPDDAQWLESKKFSVEEVARILNLPPHILKQMDRATFSNIEQQSIELVVYCLRPTYVRWEHELNRKLLAPEERGKYEIGFNLNALLRGDSAARAAFYAMMRQWGGFSANDIMELEDRPGIGEQGDIYLTPINMANAKDLVGGGAPMPAPAPPGYGGQAGRRGQPRPALRSLPLRRRIRRAHYPLIEDRARQIVGREISAVEKMTKGLLAPARSRRSLADLQSEIDRFYEEHSTWAAQRMQPVINSYAETIAAAMASELGTDPEAVTPAQFEKFVKDYIGAFGVREASEGRLQLLALVDQFKAQSEDAVAEAVQERLDEWGQKRAGKIADTESVRFMGAAAKVLYAIAGVTVLRWVASAGACPFCQAMDGKVAGIQHNFVNAGQGVDGGPDAGAPMRPSDNIGHPPLHNNCECDIVAD